MFIALDISRDVISFYFELHISCSTLSRIKWPTFTSKSSSATAEILKGRGGGGFEFSSIFKDVAVRECS